MLAAWRPLIMSFLVLTLLSTVPLYLFSDRTDRYFAWTIRPPLSAAFLGGGYAAGFVLILLTARERIWARARIALATVCVFVWLTLAVTLLHLDRFHFDTDTLSAQFLTWLWLVVYLAVPPWMTVLLLKQRRAPGSDPDVANPVPRWLVLALGAQGVLLLLVGTGLLVSPNSFDRLWPWALTPLTGRAIGAWCAALGFAAALAVRETDLGRLRGAAVTYTCLGVLQAAALLRFSAQVDWERTASIAYLAVLAAVTLTGAYGWRAVRRVDRIRSRQLQP